MIDYKFEVPTSNQLLSFNNIMQLTPQWQQNLIPQNLSLLTTSGQSTPTFQSTSRKDYGTNLKKQLGANGINAVTGIITDQLSDKLLGDSELGSYIGSIFSSGINSAGNTMSDNLIKGQALTQGLGQNVGSSIAGTAAGILGNLAGKGINELGGDTWTSRFIGQGVGSTIGSIGGSGLSNVIQGEKAFGAISDTVKGLRTARTALQTAKTAKTAATAANDAVGILNTTKSVNNASQALKAARFTAGASIGSMAGQIVGSALQAANGPSKEYQGKYGNITKGMDTTYDTLQTAIGFVPGFGQIASAAMALNKGLSNIFGSTSGMTKQDAILGSAFMPAPIKWLNMAGARTTDTFHNQSWQNTERADSFMQNSFGNLGNKFDKAREEAGKTYGTFSRHAYNKASNNLNFANYAWDQIMAMADQNELQNIRSQAMSSINNQRYAQDIQGGRSPMARGKYGMKILNNQINHSVGMRLLSGAALIDDKQMILSRCKEVD